MKRTYLLHLFGGLFFLFLSSFLSTPFTQEYDHMIFSKEYAIIGSSDVTNLLGFFMILGFFLGLAPFILFANLEKQPDKRILIWLITVFLIYLLIICLRKLMDDIVQDLILIALFYHFSGIQFGMAIQSRYKDLVNRANFLN
jgi:hypothetical protein